MLEKLGQTSNAFEAYSQAISLARADDPAWPAHDRSLRQALLSYLLIERCRFLKQLNRPAEAQADFLEATHIPARSARFPQSPFKPIDLRPHLNRALAHAKLTHALGATNSIAPLLAMGGVEFELCGYIEVWGETGTANVQGIQVSQYANALHFLHTCAALPGCADGTCVGAYVVHYAGGRQEEIRLLYGQHVRTWSDTASALGRASEAWAGKCEDGSSFRLFKHTWQNPHPELEIQSIDCLTNEVEAHPLLFAITAEK
jgi:hypothetical protein